MSDWEAAYLAYKGKIRTAARNAAYVSPDHDIEDMEQELLLVLADSVKRYDPQRGATFNSFFWMRAKQRIHQLATRAKAQCRSGFTVSLEEEAVAAAIDQSLASVSAETVFLAEEHVRNSGRGHLRGLAAYWRQREEAVAAG